MRIFIYIAIVCAVLMTAACVPSDSQTKNQNASSPSPSASPSPSPVKESAEAKPITFPVLDAFFADNSFAEKLKTRLKLSDDEVSKLKELAHSETAKLDEGELEKGDANITRVTETQEKIKSILGAEKSEQLAGLVNELWQGEDASEKTVSAGDGKLNQVPKDTRVVVNAPAYRMDVFDKGNLVKSYKIAIGYPEFPLPTGLRKARTIIFNPTWTPPDEPWVAKMKNISAGQKVEAGSRLNPLGPIKIPIGGPSLIHGGKPPAKLGKFGSHGCVGLTTPQIREFSKQLAGLGGADLTDAAISDYARAKTETKELKLKEPVAVELRYETIVVEDGSLHIYRDVYDENTNTEEKLQAVLQSYGISMNDLTGDERTQVLAALQKMSGNSAAPGKTPSPGASNNKEETKTQPGAKPAKQTRSPQSQNEMVITIAALKGKGYPAPVGL
jgi:lipoprotein-anchoring transpeptidase ErfK/SrfK/cell division septation protein DedD